MKPLLGAQSVLNAHGINYECKKTNTFDYSNLPIVSGNGFVDSVYKTFDSLWKNEETDGTGWFLLASLNKLTKEKK